MSGMEVRRAGSDCIMIKCRDGAVYQIRQWGDNFPEIIEIPTIAWDRWGARC